MRGLLCSKYARALACESTLVGKLLMMFDCSYIVLDFPSVWMTIEVNFHRVSKSTWLMSAHNCTLLKRCPVWSHFFHKGKLQRTIKSEHLLSADIVHLVVFWYFGAPIRYTYLFSWLKMVIVMLEQAYYFSCWFETEFFLPNRAMRAPLPITT